MQRNVGLLVITVVIIMLALAGNSIFRNAPLDGTWSLFLGGIIATVFGVPEVAARLREKQEAAAASGAATTVSPPTPPPEEGSDGSGS